MADATLRRLLGTPYVAMASSLNSLAAGSAVQSATVALTAGETDYLEMWISLVLGTVSGTPSANAVVAGWYLKTMNGTQEYGTTSAFPARPYDFQIQIPAVSGIASQVFVTAAPVAIPQQSTKILLYNGMGQNFPASGNTLTLTPLTIKADE
jgi:hypothetical protein